MTRYNLYPTIRDAMSPDYTAPLLNRQGRDLLEYQLELLEEQEQEALDQVKQGYASLSEAYFQYAQRLYCDFRATPEVTAFFARMKNAYALDDEEQKRAADHEIATNVENNALVFDVMLRVAKQEGINLQGADMAARFVIRDRLEAIYNDSKKGCLPSAITLIAKQAQLAMEVKAQEDKLERIQADIIKKVAELPPPESILARRIR